MGCIILHLLRLKLLYKQHYIIVRFLKFMQVSPYSAPQLIGTAVANSKQQVQQRAGTQLEVVQQIGGRKITVPVSSHEFMQLFNTVALKQWTTTGITPTATSINPLIQLRNLLPAMVKSHPQQADNLTLRLDLTTASQQGGDAVLTLLKRSVNTVQATATHQHQTVLAEISKKTLQNVTHSPVVTLNAVLTKMTDIHRKMQQANRTFLVTAQQQIAVAQQSVQPLVALCQQVVQRSRQLLLLSPEGAGI